MVVEKEMSDMFDEAKGMFAAVNHELAEMKGELAAVRRELAEHRTMAEGRFKESASRINELTAALEDGDQQMENMRQEMRQLWEVLFSTTGGDLSQHEWLQLVGIPSLSDTVLRHVSAMTHLRVLCLDGSSGFTDMGIKHLYRLPQLRALAVRNTAVSDEHLEGIGAASSLECLSRDGTGVCAIGLEHLADLPSLRSLSLQNCLYMTPACMAYVGRLTSLERLLLDESWVEDAGLQRLTSLTNLKLISLPCGITDVGMGHVKHLTALEVLIFVKSLATTKGIKCLKTLARLKEIHADGLELPVKRLLPSVQFVRIALPSDCSEEW